jgi:hypothetical protein
MIGYQLSDRTQSTISPHAQRHQDCSTRDLMSHRLTGVRVNSTESKLITWTERKDGPGDGPTSTTGTRPDPCDMIFIGEPIK